MENGRISAAPNLDESRHRLAAVAGTSTCHIVQVGLDDFPCGVNLSSSPEQTRSIRKRRLGPIQGETNYSIDHPYDVSELNL